MAASSSPASSTGSAGGPVDQPPRGGESSPDDDLRARLGAGFGGLELSSRLAQALGDEVEVTLIDRGEAFVFGFSKLDVLFAAPGHPIGAFVPPSAGRAREKAEFGTSRHARWFGLAP